jgi:hypothetical protein
MNQQLSIISEVKIKLPKNAKLFFDHSRHLYFLVHYDHVILTLKEAKLTIKNPIPKREILSVYAASPTSQKAIEDVLDILKVSDRYYCIQDVYFQLGKTKDQLKSDWHDYKGMDTGVHWKPKFVKADWQDRISALEKYDWKKGNYLWQ